MNNTSFKPRFDYIFTFDQLNTPEGVNMVGDQRLKALYTENSLIYADGRMLVNTNVAVAADEAEAAIIATWPIPSADDLKDQAIVDAYNAVAVSFAVPLHITHKLQANGRGMAELEVAGLRIDQQMQDQATGQNIEGRYFFTFDRRPGGIKLSEVDTEQLKATKPVVSNSAAAVETRVAAKPAARDFAAIKTKLEAATAKVPVVTAPATVSTATVMGKMLALGIAPATAATQAPAIAASISPENWAVASTATDEAAFKAILGAFSIALA